MGLRYGEQNGQPAAYGESVRLGEVDVSFVPAGHVLGSAQIVLVWLVFLRRSKGTDRTTHQATKRNYAEEEQRRREGTDDL
jgi:hypothetical protein